MIVMFVHAIRHNNKLRHLVLHYVPQQQQRHNNIKNNMKCRHMATVALRTETPLPRRKTTVLRARFQQRLRRRRTLSL
jgi:hypothetical protein